MSAVEPSPEETPPVSSEVERDPPETASPAPEGEDDLVGVVSVPPLTPRRLREDAGFTEQSVAPWAIGGPVVIALLGLCAVLGSLTGTSDEITLTMLAAVAGVIVLSAAWVWITALVAEDVRLLCHGIHTRGTAVEWEGSELKYTFHDMLGHERTGSFFTSGKQHRKVRARLGVGSPLEVVFDPRDPARSLPANFMFGKFEPVPAPAEDPDVRPARPAPPEGAEVEGDLLRIGLYGSSVPFADTFWKMVRRRREHVEVGRLALDDEKLVAWLPEKAGGVVELRWETPFTVMLSAWLLEGGRLRLFVSLRPQGMRSGQPTIGFQTELGQGQVSRRVPVKFESYLFVLPGEFQKLWAAVAERAAIHGADPRLDVASVIRPGHHVEVPQAVSVSTRSGGLP